MSKTKKSIGVFGDSYTTKTLHNTIVNNDSVIWPFMLDREFDVTNYGQPGNSVYGCYKDYMYFGNRHDYNIIVIPLRTRFYSSRLNASEIRTLVDFENWYANYPSVLIYEKKIKNKNLENADNYFKIFDSLKTYYEQWEDEEFLSTVNDALVDRIKTFQNVWTIEVQPLDKNQIGLFDISRWELEIINQFTDTDLYINNPMQDKKFLRDNRNCHLTEENNIALGKIVLDAVKNNKPVELKMENFVRPTAKAASYFEWIDL